MMTKTKMVHLNSPPGQGKKLKNKKASSTCSDKGHRRGSRELLSLRRGPFKQAKEADFRAGEGLRFGRVGPKPQTFELLMLDTHCRARGWLTALPFAAYGVNHGATHRRSKCPLRLEAKEKGSQPSQPSLQRRYSFVHLLDHGGTEQGTELFNL